ncbi:MAG: response regulator [Ralstonia sp.]|jgi:signal transduction histidine kinase|uniref:hybrid sensor histidine kinase/response regulator n=2 Tax=Ralstonia TaxID=48736 RepID=UPI00397D4B20
MRILLIEDDRAIASGIHAGLTQAGHRVHAVHDGVFAAEQLNRQTHDLVILDLGLPGIDGMTLLSQYRARDRSTPVLILTARDSLQDKVDGLNAGADDYLLKPFEMLELVALAFDTGAEWVPRALAHGLDLGFEAWPQEARSAAPLGAPVLANAVLLHEAIGNLLDNAVKYVPSGGRVTLRAGIDADAASRWWGVVSVEDNGPGIAADRREDVFQRFFRGDADHRPDQPPGSGLGLAIVHDIVRLHGGTVAIDDALARDGGRVMRFVLRLPLVVDAI